MTHDITKEQYISNPCGVCATAYWKNSCFNKPDNIRLIHERDMHSVAQNARTEKYFRLIHNLRDMDAATLSDEYSFQTVDIKTQKESVAHFINRCYEDMDIRPEHIDKWTKYSVFDNTLWVFIYENASVSPVALGIADFDKNVREGSLEWIQVLPQKRGHGLGKAVVSELLLRLKDKASFVTVSGQTDNKTNPESLYRECGFTGNDYWYVVSAV